MLSGKGIKLVNLQLGQGFDTLTTLSYYGYTDPICYLGILAKGSSIEAVYAITVFIRAYLAGIAFGFYERKIGIKDQFALAFSVTIYVFSGYFLLLMGRHPYFLNGALYLPLMLIGVERILEERKWLMFTLVTAAMLIVNFYFAYMNTIATIIYIIIRLIARLHDKGIKESFKTGIMLLCSYLLGAGLSACVFLPIASLYLNNSRLGIKAGYNSSMLRYPKKHYITFFSSLFVPGINPNYYSRLGFSPLSLIGLLGLLRDRKRTSLQAILGLILCFVVACIPGLGNIMNGNAYVSNRWIYILAFFLCLCAGLGLQNIFQGKANLKVASIVALVYAAFLFIVLLYMKEYKATVACLLISIHAVSFFLYSGKGKRALKGLARITALLLAISCCTFVLIEYISIGYNRDADLADKGVYQRALNTAVGTKIEDDAFYRVNQYHYNDPNSSILDYSGTSFYWSLINSDISEYYRSLWLPTQTKPYQIYGLGGNTFMNAVASVKYYVQLDKDGGVIPFGYEKQSNESGESYEIYKNKYALPLGYAYEHAISESAYLDLPVAERIQALSKFAVIEGIPADSISEAPKHTVIEIPFSLEESDWDIVQAPDVSLSMGEQIKLNFDLPDNYELYLMLDGLTIVQSEDSKIGVLNILSNVGMATANISDPKSNFYCPQDGMAVCLGHGKLDYCVIQNESTKDYHFDRIRLYGIPLSEYEEDVQKLYSEGLTNVQITNNAIKGDVAVGGDRILQISIPYNGGWTALVDGKAEEIFRCGGMYMGLSLSEGSHHVELRYTTPGLKKGFIISAASGIVIILLALFSKRQSRDKQQSAKA